MTRWLLICAMTGVACGGAAAPAGAPASTSNSASPASTSDSAPSTSEKRRTAPCLALGSDCGGDHECCDAGEVKCLPPLEGTPNPNKTVCRRP